MGGFEELLERAGFLRDAGAIGAIPESDRPAPHEVDRLYDEVAAEAGVDSESLLLEFAPVECKRGSRPTIHVAVWYDADLTAKERRSVVEALRRRFGTTRTKPSPRRPTRSRVMS